MGRHVQRGHSPGRPPLDERAPRRRAVGARARLEALRAEGRGGGVDGVRRAQDARRSAPIPLLALAGGRRHRAPGERGAPHGAAEDVAHRGGVDDPRRGDAAAPRDSRFDRTLGRRRDHRGRRRRGAALRRGGGGVRSGAPGRARDLARHATHPWRRHRRASLGEGRVDLGRGSGQGVRRSHGRGRAQARRPGDARGPRLRRWRVRGGDRSLQPGASPARRADAALRRSACGAGRVVPQPEA